MPTFLTSADIARILGISPATVRRWANAGLLPAERTAGGHRRFSLSMAERLARTTNHPQRGLEEWLAVLIEPGLPLAIDAALLAERSASAGWYAVAETLGRVLVELGTRWERGQLTAVEEHLASARLGRALARIADGLAVRPGAPRALLATPEGDAHTLGLSLVEVVMREWGWATRWIGPVPEELLARRLGDGACEGEVLAVSASVYSGSADLARAWSALAPACEREGIDLVVGGSGPWPRAAAEAVTDLEGLRPWMEQVDGRSVARTPAGRRRRPGPPG